MNVLSVKFTPVTVLALLSVLFGYNSVTVAVTQAQTAPPKPKYQYPQEIIETYITLCTQQSVDQGLTPQQSKTLCNCTLNQFQARYSLDEFIRIYAQVNQNQETPEEWIDIGLACAEELGVTHSQPTFNHIFFTNILQASIYLYNSSGLLSYFY